MEFSRLSDHEALGGGKKVLHGRLKIYLRLGTVAHASNPSTLGEAQAGGTRSQEFKTSLTNMVKLHFY